MANKKSALDEKVFDGVRYLSLSVASVGTPYSQEYLSLIARKGKLPAKKLGRNWYVTKEALTHYVKVHGNHDTASQEPPEDPVSAKTLDGVRYLTLAEAAKGSPHSQEYLSLLARSGKLPARKLGRNWHVTEDAIEHYLNARGNQSIQEPPVVTSTPASKSRFRTFAVAFGLVLILLSGVVIIARGMPGISTGRSILAAIGGTLTPPAGAPTGTMHSLGQLYDVIAGAFTSGSITANQNGSLMENLKFIEQNMDSLGVTSNSLDFDELANSMTVDEPTTVNATAGLTFTNASVSGMFEVGTLTLQNALNEQYIDPAIARDSELHNPVTLAGLTYLTLSGQQITAGPVNLATQVIGTLNIASTSFNPADFLATTGGTLTGHLGGTTASFSSGEFTGYASASKTFGSGLTACTAANQFLQWNSVTGTFSCATTASSRPASNSLDFDEFVNNMTLDANTSINNNGFALTMNSASVSTNFEVAGTASVSALFVTGAITHGTWNGSSIDVVHGGTGQSSYSTGDTIYADGTNLLTKLPGNFTTTQKFLSQTGTGTNSLAPSWQTVPSAGLSTYFFFNTASDIATYFQQKNPASTGPLQTMTRTGLTHGATTTLANFATNVGFPNLTFLPPGVTTFYITAAQTNGTRTVQLVGELYQRTSGGVETLLSTTAQTANLTGINAAYIFQGAIPTGVTFLATDRVVARVRAVVSAGAGPSVDVTISMENSTAARMDLPAAIVDVTNFVPYSGAVLNVDLGSFNIKANNASVSNNLEVSGTASASKTFGSGLTACTAANQFLQWNSVTGTFSCATTASSRPASNSLDFDELMNNMNLDANTDIASHGFTLTTSANVGIGTTTPVQKLDVAGSINISAGSAYRYNNVLFAMASTSLSNYFTGGAGNLTMTGDNNIANGYLALVSNTIGTYNTAEGVLALTSNTSGGYNTAIGAWALRSNASGGSQNTAIGANVLTANISGSSNTAVGTAALVSNTSGAYNVAIGREAIYTNQVGANNTAVGTYALHSILFTNFSTAIGAQALYDQTNGSNNTAVGYNTGRGITSGANDTIIGANVTGLAPGLSNTIIIADGAGNQRIYVDSGGNTGIGTTNVDAKLEVAGTASISGVTTLKGVSYTWPSAQGTSGTFLRNDGSGILTWTTAGGGGGVTSNSLNFDELQAALIVDTDTTITAGANALTFDHASVSANFEVSGLASSSQLFGAGLSDCDSAVTSKLLWDATTGRFSCGSDQTGGGGVTGNSLDFDTFVNNMNLDANTDIASHGFTLTTSAKVGIGTTTPVQKLDVAGSINISKGSAYRYNDVQFAMASTSLNNYFTGGAGNLTMTGANNTGNGYQALFSDTTGPNNTADGYQALRSNTSGSSNTANGFQAMFSTTTGFQNTAIGYKALFTNVTGNSNTATGYFALTQNTGSSNTANGHLALIQNTTGSYNTAVGKDALNKNTVGNYNTAVGSQALSVNTAGDQNSSFGMNSLQDLNITAAGTGNNTAVGFNTGRGIVTGINNTIIGANVTGLAAGLSNAIIIADGEGKRRINITSGGNTGIGTITPGVLLHVATTSFDGNIFRLQDSDGTCDHNPESGTETVTCSSDVRLKSQIVDTTSALAYLKGFHIRDYTVNSSGDRLTGVIAQELRATHPELVSSASSGLLSVQQPSLWVLVKAIQELSSRTGGPAPSPTPSPTSSPSGQVRPTSMELVGDDGRTYCLTVVRGRLSTDPGACSGNAGTPTPVVQPPGESPATPSPEISPGLQGSPSPTASILSSPTTEPAVTPESTVTSGSESVVPGLPETGQEADAQDNRWYAVIALGLLIAAEALLYRKYPVKRRKTTKRKRLTR